VNKSYELIPENKLAYILKFHYLPDEYKVLYKDDPIKIIWEEAQKELLKYIHNLLKNMESIQHVGDYEEDMYIDCIIKDPTWQSLLKDFGEVNE